MKKGWEVKRLADVSAINYGFTESSNIEPVGPKFLRITDIQDDRVVWDDVPYCKIESSDLPKYRLASGDIVFARTGATTGKSFLVDEPPEAVFASYLIRLRLLDVNLLPEFVALFFQTAGYWQSIKEGSAGSAQGGFNASKLGALMIPFPGLAEQQRIVGILDEAFEGIARAKANAEKNLQNARALFESHLQSVFSHRGEGWVETTLGDIAQIKGGKRVPKGYKLLAEPTDHPYLRVTDFTDFGTIEVTDLRYITPKIHQEIQNYVIYSTDLYMSIAGTIGKTGIIPEELDGSNLTENACRLVFNEGISNRFVYYFTVTPDFVDQAGLNTRTAAQPKLALSRLSTIKLGIPSFPEQKRLADEFDVLREETQRLAAVYTRKLAALEGLKKSLLHQAFSGEL